MKKHEYHCVLCGEQLIEIGLGFLECPKCKKQYLPTINDKEQTASITWKNDRV
jgi:DNA-directed RNA polymerase subunit RPC12/RpoP